MSSVIQTITRMRSREELAEIVKAATARDIALMQIEFDRRAKVVFGKFALLNKGDNLYIHAPPDKVHPSLRWLLGQPITVVKVVPRNREVMVSGMKVVRIGTQALRKRVKETLTWCTLDRLKISTEPTPEALAYVLNGGNDD